MTLILKNLKIFQPAHLIDRGNIVIDNQVIAEVNAGSDHSLQGEEIDLEGLMAIPGYIDTHCHGAMGYDAND